MQLVDVGDGAPHALAAIAARIAVAQFDRFVLPGRGARRHRSGADDAVVQLARQTRSVGVPRESRISMARIERITAVIPKAPVKGRKNLRGHTRVRIQMATRGMRILEHQKITGRRQGRQSAAAPRRYNAACSRAACAADLATRG